MNSAAKSLGRSALFGTVLAAGTALAGATWSAGVAQNGAVPVLMLPYGSGWSGGIGGMGGTREASPESYLPDDYLNGQQSIQAAIRRGVAPDKVRTYLQVRTFGQYIPPASGIGPVSDDPDHPYFNNAMRGTVGKDSTFRVADLNDAAAKNLMPWAVDALKKQNALTLVGRNGETRQARCWPLGVPDVNEVPQPLYFIQTPSEVVMYLGHRVRHIYMNVPHSRNPAPGWYGESVGHYEGDTLIVDTIGQNDKTFVDGYRTPHTTQIHVIERFRVISGGKALDTSFTVDDPGTFYSPWAGRRPRYMIADHPLDDTDVICAAGNEDRFNLGLDPIPHSDSPDF